MMAEKPKIRVKAASVTVTGRESIMQGIIDIKAGTEKYTAEEAEKVLAEHVKGYAVPKRTKPRKHKSDRVTVEEPLLTQAEIKALTASPTAEKKEETWPRAIAGVLADITIFAALVVAFGLIVDVGIMGAAGYTFAVSLLHKAQQFQP